MGIVSWGEWCADPDFPGVNARVSYAADWIDAVVCNISASPPADFNCHTTITREQRRQNTVAMLFVAGILVVVILSLKGRKKDNSALVAETKNQTTNHEGERLLRHVVTRRGSSYDSVGVEVTNMEEHPSSTD